MYGVAADRESDGEWLEVFQGWSNALAGKWRHYGSMENGIARVHGGWGVVRPKNFSTIS